MPVYPPSIYHRSCSPRKTGEVFGANAVGTDASFECGCFTRFSAAIDVRTKTINEARFRSNGCGYMIAAADVIAEAITGVELTSLHSIDAAEFTAMITDALGVFPNERAHCLSVVLASFRAALADHRAYILEEFSGEKALICTCFGITEEMIEQHIASHTLCSVDEVTQSCRAGGGCGACRMLIQELLDSNDAKRVGRY